MIPTSHLFPSNGANLNTVEPVISSKSNTHTHTLAAMLMNLQRQGCCPAVELAAECELSPRGEGANKTQHNTNKPLSWCEPGSHPAGWAGSGTISGNQLGQWGGIHAPSQQSPIICTSYQIITRSTSCLVPDWLVSLRIYRIYSNQVSLKVLLYSSLVLYIYVSVTVCMNIYI